MPADLEREPRLAQASFSVPEQVHEFARRRQRLRRLRHHRMLPDEPLGRVGQPLGVRIVVVVVLPAIRLVDDGEWNSAAIADGGTRGRAFLPGAHPGKTGNSVVGNGGTHALLYCKM